MKELLAAVEKDQRRRLEAWTASNPPDKRLVGQQKLPNGIGDNVRDVVGLAEKGAKKTPRKKRKKGKKYFQGQQRARIHDWAPVPPFDGLPVHYHLPWRTFQGWFLTIVDSGDKGVQLEVAPWRGAQAPITKQFDSVDAAKTWCARQAFTDQLAALRRVYNERVKGVQQKKRIQEAA